MGILLIKLWVINALIFLRGSLMGKIIIFIIGLCLIFGVNVSARSFTKDVNLIDIIVFENFEYKELKDDFLKQVGIDVNYITIFNNAKKEITESNYKEFLTDFHNELIYDYKRCVW